MPLPGVATFRMAGKLSVNSSVGMLRWMPPVGVVTVMRQYMALSVAATVGAEATASNQLVPSRGDSLTIRAWAWPLTTGVPMTLADAQSTPPASLPSGGCGPADGGRPSKVRACPPVQAVLVSVTGPAMAALTWVIRRTLSDAPTASEPPLVRRHTTRRQPAPPESAAPLLQVQPGSTKALTPTYSSALGMVSTMRSGVAPVAPEYTAGDRPLLVTKMSLSRLLSAAMGPAVLYLAMLRSA